MGFEKKSWVFYRCFFHFLFFLLSPLSIIDSGGKKWEGGFWMKAYSVCVRPPFLIYALFLLLLLLLLLFLGEGREAHCWFQIWNSLRASFSPQLLLVLLGRLLLLSWLFPWKYTLYPALNFQSSHSTLFWQLLFPRLTFLLANLPLFKFISPLFLPFHHVPLLSI